MFPCENGGWRKKGWEPLLCIYENQIETKMEYFYHNWAGGAQCSLSILGRVQKLLRDLVSLPRTSRRNVPRYFHGRFSGEPYSSVTQIQIFIARNHPATYTELTRRHPLHIPSYLELSNCRRIFERTRLQSLQSENPLKNNFNHYLSYISLQYASVPPSLLNEVVVRVYNALTTTSCSNPLPWAVLWLEIF